jgi:hypothetical protein
LVERALKDLVLDFEAARRRVEAEECAAGSLSDYLDRGRPNPEQARRARADIWGHEAWTEAERRALCDLVSDTRCRTPQAMAAWVEAHIVLCDAIAAEPADADWSSGVRPHVARQTRAAWEKVISGAECHVRINWYFLFDYEDRLDRALRAL